MKPEEMLNAIAHDTAFDVLFFLQPLNKRIPKNPRYKHVKSVLDTGESSQCTASMFSYVLVATVSVRTVHKSLHSAIYVMYCVKDTQLSFVCAHAFLHVHRLPILCCIV